MGANAYFLKLNFTNPVIHKTHQQGRRFRLFDCPLNKGCGLRWAFPYF
jgi:hypothetical protein